MAPLEPVDVLIIGGGPAGLTAALTLVRQGHTAILFDSGSYRNVDVKHMHMIPIWDHQNPAEFREKARFEILNHYASVRIEDGEVTAARSYHCLYCEGYEDRGTARSGVLAIQTASIAPMAIHLAENAANLSSRVTIYTHGSEELSNQIQTSLGNTNREKFMVDSRKISHLRMVEADGTPAGVELTFADGTSVTEGFIVHNPFTKVQGPFVEQLGIETTTPSPAPEVGDIVANFPAYQTSVRGVFAAGDSITQYEVIAGAISSGCNAAVAASAQLLAEKYQHQSLV